MKFPIIRITALSLLLTVSSCKIGKQYKAPELYLPSVIIEGETDSVSLADKSWEEVYTDPILRKLIRKSLQYNKDMLIAAARIKEMAAMKRIAAADLYPQITAEIAPEREYENHGGNHAKKNDTFDGKLHFSWELDLWGNLRWAKDKSLAEYLQSVEAQKSLQMTIVAEVAQAYYELVALDHELYIVRQTLEARKEGLRLAKIRFDGGLTSETPYQQAQVELARTTTLVPDLERKISLKENDIAFLAGEHPNPIERGESLQRTLVYTRLPVGLPSDLLQRRPDVRQAEQEMIAANATVGIAYTNLFPRITLTGQYGLESNELSDFIKSPYGLIGGSLLSPIFMMGKNRANWHAKQAAYEQTRLQYEKTVLTVFKEARNAIVDFNKIKEVYDARLKWEQSAKSYVDLAQLQYINGVINYLDVLDAQRVYFDAQIGLSNALRDEQIAMVRLYKALGGGY